MNLSKLLTIVNIFLVFLLIVYLLCYYIDLSTYYGGVSDVNKYFNKSIQLVKILGCDSIY